MDIEQFVARAISITRDAHLILGTEETSRSRVIRLEESYRKIDKLSVKQDDLFKQSLRCIENELYRAAHVMAWAAFIDFLEHINEKDNFTVLNAARSKWNITSLNQLRESYPEAQVIDAMKEANLISKNEAKAFHGLLTRRNECAHPSDYYPDLNSSLGYLSEILQRLTLLKKRF
jgi:hypothetical protein